MTANIITYPEGRIDHAQRKELATTLTDAVLVLECGQIIPAARGDLLVGRLDHRHQGQARDLTRCKC